MSSDRSALADSRRLQPLEDLYDIAERLMFVFEHPTDIDEFERVVEAVVRRAPAIREAQSIFGAAKKRADLKTRLEALWQAWWSIRSTGEAVATVQYISCLMYPASENPVFDPWTPDEGGGPPTLWEYVGDLYEDCWRPENVTFLEQTLCADYVEQHLKQAVEQLAAETESVPARLILDDFASRRPFLESRCRELPRLFATRDGSSTLKWTL